MLLFVNKTDDGLEVIGIEPMDVGIFLEPGQLFAHVAAGVRLNLTDGLVERDEAIEIIEHLFVSYGVKRVERPLVVDGQGFLDKAVLHHCDNPLVDAIIHFFARTVKAYLDDSERPLLDGATAVEGIRMS